MNSDEARQGKAPAAVRPPEPWQVLLRDWLYGARRLMVIGVGSDLHADDAAGRLVVESLAAAPPWIERFYAGTIPERASSAIRKATPSHVLIVDSAATGLDPGSVSIRSLEEADLPPSTHSAPFSLLARFLSDTGAAWLLLAIQPASLDYLTPVSAPVARAAREMAAFIRELPSPA